MYVITNKSNPLLRLLHLYGQRAYCWFVATRHVLVNGAFTIKSSSDPVANKKTRVTGETLVTTEFFNSTWGVVNTDT